MNKEDFASLLAGAAASPAPGRQAFTAGKNVAGTIVAIGKDFAFIDVGGRSEARVERQELQDATGALRYGVGDVVRGSILSSTEGEGPVMTLALGRGQIDAATLQAALESQVPVEGVVQRAVKAGLEVTIGGVRAFCPASLVDRIRVPDLAVFEGQTHLFCVLEIKDKNSVIISRRAVLEAHLREQAERLLERLTPGAEVEGTVTALQKYGAFIDLGGLEGLVHISELANTRTTQVQDVVRVGDKVRVSVLSLEQGKDGPKIRLSMKAGSRESPAAAVGKVLTGSVSKLGGHGVFVDTPEGSGFVPQRELLLPHGADFRRSFPVGTPLTVTLLNQDPRSGNLTFSMKAVSAVEERQNYQQFTRDQPEAKTHTLGSFGELLRQRLNLPETIPSPAPAPPPPPTQATKPDVEETPRPVPTPASAGVRRGRRAR